MSNENGTCPPWLCPTSWPLTQTVRPVVHRAEVQQQVAAAPLRRHLERARVPDDLVDALVVDAGQLALVRERDDDAVAESLVLPASAGPAAHRRSRTPTRRSGSSTAAPVLGVGIFGTGDVGGRVQIKEVHDVYRRKRLGGNGAAGDRASWRDRSAPSAPDAVSQGGAPATRSAPPCYSTILACYSTIFRRRARQAPPPLRDRGRAGPPARATLSGTPCRGA